MEKKAARRFYKNVDKTSQGDGHIITLDGRVLKTPAKADLVLPNQALADAIAGEFEAQSAEIVPDTMPIFSLASTVIDRIMTQRQVLDDEMVRYGLGDLICYHCEQEEDENLASRQAQKWGSVQAWLAQRYDINLATFTGIMPQTQSQDVAEKLPPIISAIDDWFYLGLYRITTLSGSLALGLGFVERHYNVDDVMALAFLDELYQEEKWGADSFAVERRDNIQREIEDAAKFLKIL